MVVLSREDPPQYNAKGYVLSKGTIFWSNIIMRRRAKQRAVVRRKTFTMNKRSGPRMKPMTEPKD